MKIRVGSRESMLAVTQSNMVIAAIKACDPEIETELITMKTTGDRILDRNLDKVGGKGLFVKELEAALREDRVDITVHSFKDVTMEVSEDIPILCVSEREDPRDCLVLPEGATEIDFSKPIGCSSLRRMLQFKEMHPEATFEPIRGNVQTRLRKLDSGMYGATLFAVAGLKRAGLENRISRIYETDEMIPAACQGILAVQGRKDQDISFLKDFRSGEAEIIAKAERSFVRTLDGGCTSPVAAYCELTEGQIKLTGLDINKEGKPFRMTITGDPADAEYLGRDLALRMKRME